MFTNIHFNTVISSAEMVSVFFSPLRGFGAITVASFSMQVCSGIQRCHSNVYRPYSRSVYTVKNIVGLT